MINTTYYYGDNCQVTWSS